MNIIICLLRTFLENALKTKFPFLLTDLALCMHISGEFCLFLSSKLHHACLRSFLGPRAFRSSRNMVSVVFFPPGNPDKMTDFTKYWIFGRKKWNCGKNPGLWAKMSICLPSPVWGKWNGFCLSRGAISSHKWPKHSILVATSCRLRDTFFGKYIVKS